MKNSIRTMFAAASLLINVSLFGDQPYDSVKTLPQTPYYVQDAYVFYSLILNNGAVIVVDVDSQDGGVARFIAQQSSNLPTVKQIYSVCAWRSNDPSQKHLYQRFLSNVKQEMTTSLITPIRMNSQEGAEELNINADFISIVGGNQADSVCKDILAWYPHLSNTGILCGNNWFDSSVQQGVTKASVMLEISLQTNNNVWYFVKGK